MLERNQELIDQFNCEEQNCYKLQLRKMKRRIRFPELGALSYAILDLQDKIRERHKPADCIGRK